MKYLFINGMAGTTSTGRLAANTCRSLMAQGHQCLLAYGRNIANCDDVPVLRIGSDMDNRINALGNRIFDNQGFGTRGPTRRFLEQVKEYDPDVIWLHNLHGYYIHVGLLFDYLRSCGKQIIWTLHDCWTMTGHCANFEYARCSRWKTGCHDCPQKKLYPSSLLMDGSRRNYALKKQAFTGIPNLTLITPSQWLADQVAGSFMGEYPVKVVRNTIDTEVFRPCPSNFRKEHGLEEKKVLLAVTNFWTAQKGIQDLMALADMLEEPWRLVIVGQVKQKLPASVIHVDRTESPRQLAQIYTAADILLNPTYEDTYPTVNLEALACGTPVITYRTGGSPESLDQSCGAVVDQNPRAMYEACMRLKVSREDCLLRSRYLNSCV